MKFWLKFGQDIEVKEAFAVENEIYKEGTVCEVNESETEVIASFIDKRTEKVVFMPVDVEQIEAE